MQRDKTRKVRIINRSAFVARIAKESDFYKNAVDDMISAMEKSMQNILLEANEDEDVCIHFMEGLTISNYYLSEHEMQHPVSKDVITVPAKTRASARVTESYRDKIKARWAVKNSKRNNSPKEKK